MNGGIDREGAAKAPLGLQFEYTRSAMSNPGGRGQSVSFIQCKFPSGEHFASG